MPPDALLTILVAITGTVFYAATKTAQQQRKRTQELRRLVKDPVATPANDLLAEINALIREYGPQADQLLDEHRYDEAQKCCQILRDKYESVELVLAENPDWRQFIPWEIQKYYTYCYLSVQAFDGAGDHDKTYQYAKELLGFIDSENILYSSILILLSQNCHHLRKYDEELFYTNELLEYQEKKKKENNSKGYANALAKMSIYYYRQGMAEKSFDYLNQAKEVIKSQAIPMTEWSYITSVELEIELIEGRYDNALLLLKQLSAESFLPLSTQNPFTWAHHRRLIAVIAIAQNQYEEAHEYLECLLEVAGNDKVFCARYLSTLLTYLSAIDRKDKIPIIKEQFYEAVAILPDNIENQHILWLGLTDSYHHQKRYTDCINMVNHLLKEKNQPVATPLLFMVMTRCHHFLGEEDKARECWAQAASHHADTRWRNIAREMKYDDFIVSPLIKA
jgi:tetratricopeptide (TPR) repeat protein